MAENDKRLETENLAVTATSFSQLLFGDDGELVGGSLGRVGVDHIFGDIKAPRMVCFGDFAAVNDKGEAVLFSETTTKSSVTCSDSSTSASSTNNNVGSMSKSNTRKRGGGPVQETVPCTSKVTDQRLITTTSKKTKSENPKATVPINKRKEKLGERIAALQQLVSPFGKSDTASVLHEAMGYIRFLQEQVQVLCSPYLQRLSKSLLPSEKEQIEITGGIRKDLRSRGLCLVPTDCTEQLVNDNGADLWSPSMAGAMQ